MIRAVIFDFFGTLVPNFTVAWNTRVLDEMARTLKTDPADFVHRWVDTFDRRAVGELTLEENIRVICRESGDAPEDAAIVKALRIRIEAYRKVVIPRPGAVAILKQLRQRGIQTGLVSDCSDEVVDEWPRSELAPLIDHATFSCMIGVKKPDPNIYLNACEQLDLPVGECLYVGDGGSDELSGARGVGMRAVLFRDPDLSASIVYRSEAQTWEGPAISSFAELSPLLESGGPGGASGG